MFEVQDWEEYKRGIAILTGITMFGVVAAVASAGATTGQPAAEAATNSIAVGLVVPAILVQIPLYETVYEEWGEKKDMAYVGLMTFLIWFVTWSVLLTSGILF